MPSERTFVTELATGLGMLGDNDLDSVLARRPAEFVNLRSDDWDRLADLWTQGRCGGEFVDGFLNGRAFLAAPDALHGRSPRIIEWTGGRRPPGDEVVPSDLRIDHVYLVSCKYLSGILHNPSPARLVEGLLSQAPGGAGRVPGSLRRMRPGHARAPCCGHRHDDGATPFIGGVPSARVAGWRSGGVRPALSDGGQGHRRGLE